MKRLDMGMPEEIADGFFDALERLFKDSECLEPLFRYRTRHVFRGHSNKDYSLKTTLQRLDPTDVDPHKIEKVLIRQFKKFAHRDVVERDTGWHWLSIARHHSLPTRLLDWTNSPLTALHFVTDNLRDFNEDGVVYCLNIHETYRHLPDDFQAYLQGRRAVTIDELSDLLKCNGGAIVKSCG